MEMVLKSHKTPYEKKIALFNCLKDIEVGESEPEQKERINHLIQGRLFMLNLPNKVWKSMRISTVKEYSEKE